MTAVTPLADLGQRMPIVGKLRHGVYKSGRPQAITTWRLTTSSRPFADDFARRYGGTVQSMTNPNSPHQWEVISDTDEVAIALVPDGFMQSYELWSAGGCQRRCDGETASVIDTSGPDSVEYVETPCICDRKGALECSLKTRLTFVLPDLPFRGGVVYETGSQNFAEESRGMIALIQQLQAAGVTRGVLRLEQRKSSGNRKFTCAALGVDESPDALASGEAASRSLGRAPSRPALSAPSAAAPAVEGGEGASPPTSTDGSPGPSLDAPSPSTSFPEGEVSDGEADAGPSGEEDIVDAEIVDEEPPELPVADQARMRATFMAIVKGLGLSYDDDVKPFLQHHYDGRSWGDLTAGERQSLVGRLTGGENRQEKEARQQDFARKVREFANSF